ncbi:MAG: PAS domain-containing protein [Nitratireductor sp.]
MDDILKVQAFDAAPIGIVLTEHRTIVSCNQTFCDITQYSKEELINQSFKMLYSSKDEFDIVRDVGIAALQEDGEYKDQRVLRRKDGSLTWCGFRAKTLTPKDPIASVVLTYSNLAVRDDALVLTPRERDIVLGLTRGETSKETAQLLGLSRRTVEDVKSRLFKKYKVRSASELIWYFVRADI